jgi:hypothetical protein
MSMVIFALIVAGLGSLFIGTKTQLFHFQHRMVSSQLASVFLDPLLQDVRADEQQASSNCLYGDINCPGQENINGIDYNPSYTFSDIAVGGDNIRKAELQITWTEIGP